MVLVWFWSIFPSVHTGPVRNRTSSGTCSHGYGIVSFRSISRQKKQKKISRAVGDSSDKCEPGCPEATFIRERYRRVIVPVWFLERKSRLFTRVRSVIVPVLGPVHTGTVSYRSEAFRAKKRKRKSDMSTNFKHWRISIWNLTNMRKNNGGFWVQIYWIVICLQEPIDTNPS